MRSVWYLDSGCSRHMTGKKEYLIGYIESRIGSVTFDRVKNKSSLIAYMYPN